VIALGITAGALLAEGAVLVPFWRSLPSDSFLRWYRENGHLLLRFFGPLEVVTAVLVTLAAVASWLSADPAVSLLVASSLLSLLVLAAFPFYFQRANASFAEGTIETDRVEAALRRWAGWHWVRTAIAIAAFLFAILASSR
jgi:hypothetical protein